MNLLPECSYYLRRLLERTLRQHLHRVTDLLKTSGEPYYEPEQRLHTLYPDTESYSRVILHLEKLIWAHRHAKKYQDLNALKDLTAQLLWWLGYDTRFSSKGPTVFVVDHIIDVIERVTTILSSSGYRVDSALNGQLALMMIGTRLPDLVLLDPQLSDMDGYEFYQTLNNTLATAHIPVIFLREKTPNFIGSDPLKQLPFLLKPFESQDLLEIVKQHLQSSSQAKALPPRRDGGLDERLYQALKLTSPLGLAAQENYLDAAIYFFRTTLDGRYLRVSSSFAYLCGYDSPEALAFHVSNIWEQIYVDSDHREKWNQCLRFPNEFQTFTAYIRTKQGKTLEVVEKVCVVEDAYNNRLFYQGHLKCSSPCWERTAEVDQKTVANLLQS